MEPTKTKTTHAEIVNKATGRAATVDTGKEVKAIGNAGAMFSEFKESDLNEMALSGKYEFAPQLMELKVGQKIEGILEGYGPGSDFEDDDGDVRHVHSWIIMSPDGTLRASILSSKQLDTKMPPFIGMPVVVARKEDIKLAQGHRCGDYHVGGPRLKGGETRRWGTATPPGEVQAQIAAAPEVPQLAAPMANGAAEHAPAAS
jgi:hypothetical protein